MVEKIKEIMASVFGVGISKISEDISPETTERWDSFNHMNLVFCLEEEFKVQFSDEEVMELISIPRILEILRSRW